MYASSEKPQEEGGDREKAGLTSGQNIQNFAGAMHGFPVCCADLHRITRGIERNQYTFLDKEVLINRQYNGKL